MSFTLSKKTSLSRKSTSKAPKPSTIKDGATATSAMPAEFKIAWNEVDVSDGIGNYLKILRR